MKALAPHMYVAVRSKKVQKNLIAFRGVLHEAINNDSLRRSSDLLYYQTQRLWHFIFDRMDFTLLVEDELENMRRSIAYFKERDPEKSEQYRKKVLFAELNRVRSIFEFY